jgi:hypothetical protein
VPEIFRQTARSRKSRAIAVSITITSTSIKPIRENLFSRG